MGSTEAKSTNPVRKTGESLEGPAVKALQGGLAEISLLVSLLESERDLLVSGDWEKLDAVLAEKDARSRRLADLLSELSAMEEDCPEEAVTAFRSALVHLSELVSVNLVLARESSLLVGQVLREISHETEGGGTYGAGGTVDISRPSPAMVSTRG